MPLNDKGKEITEEDDIFIDDPRQLVSSFVRSLFVPSFVFRSFISSFLRSFARSFLS